MKKLLIIMLGVFLLTGCGSTDKGEELTCYIDNKEAVFTLKDGVLTSFTLDGKKQSASTVDEINGTYFTSSTNNEEGKEALINYIISVEGSCDF